MKINLKAARNSCIYGIVMALVLSGCGGSAPTPAVLTSIAITPDPVYIGLGTTLKLTATGKYSDGTTTDLSTKVKWTSANPTTIASVDATGLLTVISTNSAVTTTVTATLNGIISHAVTINLTAASSTSTFDLKEARYDHTATELQTASGVLVAGGYGIDGKVLKSSELYDLTNRTWTTVLNPMNFARRDHTATLLANGQVLLLGGGGDAGINDLDTAELFTPATQSWTSAANLSTLNETRSYHTATLLNNGKVLVVGGGTDNKNEIYDPAAAGGKATYAASDISTQGRYSHTATRLLDGSVLVAGGFDIGLKTATATTELFDQTGMLNSVVGSLAIARYLHSATLLQDGRVLVAGGTDETGHVFASAELFDPNSKTWSTAAPMNTPRFGQTATLMPNGKVLVMGGINATDPAISSAELYTPDATGGKWTPTANLQFGRDVGTATLLTSGPDAGSVLVTGGIGTIGILKSVELHN